MFSCCCQQNDRQAAAMAGSRTLQEDHEDVSVEEAEERIMLQKIPSVCQEEGPVKSNTAIEEAAPLELAGHGDGATAQPAFPPETMREMPRDEGAAATAGEHVAAGSAGEPVEAAAVQEIEQEPAQAHPQLQQAHPQLQALRVELRKRSVTLVPGVGETEDEMMMRFFIARANSVDKAATMLAEDARWRLEKRVDALRDMSAKEVLGCDPGHIHSIMPHTCRGFDREGRPLVFKHCGKQCKPSKCLNYTTLAKLLDYVVWLNEQHTIALRDAGQQQWTIVVDAKGLHLGLLDSTAVRLFPSMAETDSKHYPERLAAVLVVNAPSAVAVIWNIIKPNVDAKTQKKVAIISDRNAAEAKQRLHELIAPDQLPAQFGGTAPALSPWPEYSGFA